MTTQELLLKAGRAKASLAALSGETKRRALLSMAACIDAQRDLIHSANQADIEAATGVLSPAMIDRLTLTDGRIDGMIQSIQVIAAQPDPVGRILWEDTRPNGLVIRKVAVPFGVIAMIYESRPNVTADAAALCFASGNVCVLRGGKEAYRSSAAIANAMQSALEQEGLSRDYINLIEDTTRQSAAALMGAVGLVDLLIPRGGKALIDRCVSEAKVPCIQTGTGICHVYVDRDADLPMAADIIVNAKASRPSVCNAAEVCLVHRAVAAEFLPMLRRAFDAWSADGKPTVSFRVSPAAAAFVQGVPAGPDDFDTEFLDYILAIDVVDSLDDAVAHIAAHSTGHSEAIITRSSDAAGQFTKQVDSAAVYVNASTRFTDGGEFGFGGEIGISTQRLHARGPIGLQELTTHKYIINGNGQIR